jgi:hypothetical protein
MALIDRIDEACRQPPEREIRAQGSDRLRKVNGEAPNRSEPMVHRASPILLVLGCASTLVAAGCQNMAGTEPNQALAAYDARLARPASTQRVDENGFPLLGAYPTAAAPQLDSATVANETARLSRRAVGNAGGGQKARYDAAIRDAAAVRQQQRLAMDRALSGTGAAQAGAPRTPAN